MIYAHTDTTLLKLDPTSANLALTKVGDFDCIGTGAGQDTAMTDLAVDKAGELFGDQRDRRLSAHDPGRRRALRPKIALQNAKACSFYGLTFAPVGVLDPGQGGARRRQHRGRALGRSTSQGNLAQHGTFGTVPAQRRQRDTPTRTPAKTWELSGDIVFLANNGNPVGFATVRDCPSPPSPRAATA